MNAQPSNQSEIRHFSVAESLRNGTAITIRAVRPEDKPKLVAAFQALEPASIYARYFHHKAYLTPEDLRDVTEVDFFNAVVLVATVGQGEQEIVIGVARYYAFAGQHGVRNAEIAFTVEEDYHGQGIASRLLQHLIRIGREQGLAQFKADVLRGNDAMLSVFSRCGLAMETKQESEVIHVTLYLAA